MSSQRAVVIKASLRRVGVAWRIQWRDLIWRKLVSKFRAGTLNLSLREGGKMTTLMMPS